MIGSTDTPWNRYCEYRYADPGTGIAVDLGAAGLSSQYLGAMAPRMARALAAMARLENGEIANKDENRRVGHYWLRRPGLAPEPGVTEEIEASWRTLREFLATRSGRFRRMVHVGIGGSAVGPRLLHEAWADGSGPRVDFLDNADPDTVSHALDDLDHTLVSVVSKSGLTPTPWQVVTELEAAYAKAGVDFATHAVATTVPGNELDRYARATGWLASLPMWEWVGGRTSVTSMAGLLPAAFGGADIEAFLRGAAEMDALTRVWPVRDNPAALLALAWYRLGGGRGSRAMVVLPYRDRLSQFPRWVQQLVMESVGKRLDRDGNVVHQGLTVYGHKGVSDQHSYFQQLRDGPADSFVTLIGTHKGRDESPTALADHLFCGLIGTLVALRDHDRPVIAITVPDYRERCLGGLIALYERAVGLYAELINVNAYHQPAVDKHIAVPVLDLQEEVLDRLDGEPVAADELADRLGVPGKADVVHRLLEHLSIARPDVVGTLPGTSAANTRYWGKAHA